MTDALTPRQQRFVLEYLKDLNATQAAIRAGYSAKTAVVQGPRLLGNIQVAAAVQAASSKRLARLELKADDVLRELLRIARSDIRQLYDETGRLKPIHQLPDDVAAALSSVEILREKTTVKSGEIEEITVEESVRKLKLWDKVKALELLAKHLNLLTERTQVDGELRVRWLRDDEDEDGD